MIGLVRGRRHSGWPNKGITVRNWTEFIFDHFRNICTFLEAEVYSGNTWEDIQRKYKPRSDWFFYVEDFSGRLCQSYSSSDVQYRKHFTVMCNNWPISDIWHCWKMNITSSKTRPRVKTSWIQRKRNLHKLLGLK